MRRLILVLFAVPLLMGADRCSISWPQPQPSPTPTVEPTPTPTPEPTAPPPQPTPPPPQSACPKPLAEGAHVMLRNKPYGQGVDSTVWVWGDPEFCRMIHGDQWGEIRQCHLEGWPQMVACEMELLGATVGKDQACPVWQFYNDAFPTPRPCTDQSFEGPHMSCDHFGSAGGGRDDPKTPEFEGTPEVCGEQRDAYGPMAGFFVIAHGHGWVRACSPDYQRCAPWLPISK